MLTSCDELEEGLDTQTPLQSQSGDHTVSGSQSANVKEYATPKRGRQQGFTKEEDLLIISGYLNTSFDPVVGNGQKQDALWKRIHDYFVANGKYARSQVSISCRWNVINKDVQKFVGCYAQVQQQEESGLSEEDRVLKAEALFKASTGKTFHLFHCWNVLKNELRWSATGSFDRSNKASKKFQSVSPHSANSSPTTPDSVNLGEDNNDTSFFERPMGRKLAKETPKRNKEHTSTTTSAATILQSWKEEYTKNERAKQERIEKKLRYQEEYIALEKKKLDYEIMSKDTTGMDETRAAYFKKLQQDILNEQK
ncbi:unnamed protein product [Cuscuta campestris]|uniref:No apical meristem-associated C-terminal domain-containing protein n=1 Tax=Cuscuta campestris TaxID=132261 RepID=A0A484NAK5_9ASTE|nr:unnamed protein product [Cuscuta campestris]